MEVFPAYPGCLACPSLPPRIWNVTGWPDGKAESSVTKDRPGLFSEQDHNCILLKEINSGCRMEALCPPADDQARQDGRKEQKKAGGERRGRREGRRQGWWVWDQAIKNI